MADPIDSYDVLVNLQAGDSGEFAKQLKALSEQINKVTPEVNKWGTAFIGVMGAADDLIDKFKSGAIVTKTFAAAFSGFNDILKNMEAISVSAGMTNDQFDKLTDGIEMGAATTGKSFGAVAESARAIFEQTGLKDGLGQVVLDSERLSRTFGISETTVGKMTAQMIQFGEGTMTADDVMKSFDKTTGMTGSKLEQMLEHITDMGKTMRNIVGGGDKFSKAMKAITENTTLVAAKFQEMGGDTDAFKEIQQSILDPSKWSEISRRLPGMAGNLMQMQEAMTSGDNDRFNALLKEGAQRTVEMGAGMNAFTRSAAGFDMTTAEIFSKMDFRGIKAAGESAGGVMDRMANQFRDLGTQWNTFVNNFVAALMPVLGKLVEFASWILSHLNSFITSIQGAWFDLFVWLGMAALTGFIIVKALATKFFGWVMKQVGEAGEAVGKAAGKTVTGFTNEIAASAVNMLKASLALLALGGALFLLASAIWVMTDAFAKGNVWASMVALAAGLAVLTGALLLLGLVAPYLLPGILVMYLMGGAVLFLASAFWLFSKGVENIVDSVVKLADSSEILGKLGETIKKLAAMDFGMLDVAGTALGKFFKNLFSFGGGGETLNAKVIESIKGVIGIIDTIAGSIVRILTAGALISAHKEEFNQVFIDLFDKDKGTLTNAVKMIATSLQSAWGNTTVAENVRTSITFLIDTMSKFSSAFIGIVSLGMLINSKAGVVGYANSAIESVFGKDGFLTRMAVGASTIKDIDSVKKATDTIASMGAMIDPLIRMTALGSVLGAGKTDQLMKFAAAISLFSLSLNDTGKAIDKGAFDKLATLPALTEKLNHSFAQTIAISARGGAEVALEDHDKITREHQQNVEQLLTEIRDGIKTFSSATTPQNATTKGNEPAWHPESMFSEASEVF